MITDRLEFAVSGDARSSPTIRVAVGDLNRLDHFDVDAVGTSLTTSTANACVEPITSRRNHLG